MLMIIGAFTKLETVFKIPAWETKYYIENPQYCFCPLYTKGRRGLKDVAACPDSLFLNENYSAPFYLQY